MMSKELEFRVAYTPLGHRLYAGTVQRDTGVWVGEAVDVTSSAMFAVAEKLVRDTGTPAGTWPLPDGRVMVLHAEILSQPSREGMYDK